MENHNNNCQPNLSAYADLIYKYGKLPLDFCVGKPKWIVGLYVRLSKDDGNSVSLSVLNQIKRHAMALRSMEDFVVYEIYIDDGLTGTDFDRADYQRMWHHVSNKVINCIVVIDLTRFARNVADGIKELDSLVLEHKVRFISLDNPSIDTLQDPTAISSAEVYHAFEAAEGHARSTSKKVRAIQAIKRMDGETTGGFPPYGFLHGPDKLHWVPDPVASEYVKQIFLWNREGLSPREIAKKLNLQGILNPTSYKKSIGLKYQNPHAKVNSGFWWPTTVSRILEDRAYIGYAVQGKSSSFDHKRHKQIAKPKGEYIAVPDCHQAVISQDLFAQVGEIRSQKTRVTKSGKVHMFANLVYCSNCGKAMKKTSSKDKSYLVCRTYKDVGKEFCTSKRSISMKILESVVLKAIQTQISLVINLQAIIEQINQKEVVHRESARINQLLEGKQKDYEKSAHILDSSYFDWKNGDISHDQYDRIRDKVTEELNQLRLTINMLKNERQRLAEGINNNDEYFQRFLKYRNIETLDREILIELISKIYVNDDKSLKIEFNFQDQYLLIIDYIEQNNNILETQKTLTKKL